MMLSFYTMDAFTFLDVDLIELSKVFNGASSEFFSDNAVDVDCRFVKEVTGGEAGDGLVDFDYRFHGALLLICFLYV